jgi:hypothetical protein
MARTYHAGIVTTLDKRTCLASLEMVNPPIQAKPRIVSTSYTWHDKWHVEWKMIAVLTVFTV